MKKFLVLLALGVLMASPAFAAWYDVIVDSGQFSAAAAGVTMPTIYQSYPIVDLDPLYPPGTTVGTFYSTLAAAGVPAAPDADGWNAAGWWEFTVNSSSGSDWNAIFASTYPVNFGVTWDGIIPDIDVYFGVANVTFNQMYGKWIKNNDSVWTFFGLYVNPNTGAAQVPGLPPKGIFAFVANDPLLYPPGDFELSDVYGYPDPQMLCCGTGHFAAPEPSLILLLGLGLGAVSLFGLRREK